MGYKDLNRDSVEYYLKRILEVTGDTERRWGTMSPAQMLAHVNLLMEGSLGEVSVEGNGQIPFKWFKPIVLSGIIPFPKNRAKAPAVFLADDASSIAEERERLEHSIGRFLERFEDSPDRVQVNPIFGPMTGTQWARLHGLHLNHHLAQFGA